MSRELLTTLFAGMALFASLIGPDLLFAGQVKLIVSHDVVADNSTNFNTIQSAIDYVTAQRSVDPNNTRSRSFIIEVQAHRDPYPGPINAIEGVPIVGTSTIGTFISSSSQLPVITVNNANGVIIRNFTFLTAQTAISVVNSDTRITNNVFVVGANGTAVQVSNAPSAEVRNNSFHRNKVAINTTSNILVTNNIFSFNTTAVVAPSQLTLTRVSYNDYFRNTSDGIDLKDFNSLFLGRPLDPNPRLVNPDDADFHNLNFQLQSNSNCIGNGNPAYRNSFDSSSDMGAYGGPDSDIVVPQIGAPSAVNTPEGSQTVIVTWPAADSSVISGYRVYFGRGSRNYNGTGTSDGPTSPVFVPKGTNTTTISNLAIQAPEAIEPPTITGTAPMNRALLVTWKPVAGAAGYRLESSTKIDFSENLLSFDLTGGNVSSTIIPGLVNGTQYFVRVSAFAQTQYFFAVTAVVANTASTPGTPNESQFSPEAVAGIGGKTFSAPSRADDRPEATAAFPAFMSQGCFIATAAYGFYSAPQVQALRVFRDRFLMTNPPGRAFVAWYYRYGPIGARYLNDHPGWKPVVRLALSPLVAVALLLTSTPIWAQLVVVLLLVVALVFRLKRRGLGAPCGGAL